MTTGFDRMSMLAKGGWRRSLIVKFFCVVGFREREGGNSVRVHRRERGKSWEGGGEGGVGGEGDGRRDGTC